MERTGIEPVTSGLQTHPITRLRLTRTNRISMTEPKSACVSNVGRHRWTRVRSHRARTADAATGNIQGALSTAVANAGEVSHASVNSPRSRQISRGFGENRDSAVMVGWTGDPSERMITLRAI
jgi:hypothetical protein